DRVQMVGTNFTNSKKLSKSLIADIRIEGRPLRAGDARSQISLDPYARAPTFAFNLELKELPLVKLNKFAQAMAVSPSRRERSRWRWKRAPEAVVTRATSNRCSTTWLSSTSKACRTRESLSGRRSSAH